MTLVKSFIPVIIATIVYNLGFLNGIDTFTRLLDSLVIAFIIVASADRLIEAIRQSFFSTFSRLSDDKKEAIVPPSPNSSSEHDSIAQQQRENIISTTTTTIITKTILNDSHVNNDDNDEEPENVTDNSCVDHNDSVKVSHQHNDDASSLFDSVTDTMTTIIPNNNDQGHEEELGVSPLCQPRGMSLLQRRLQQKYNNNSAIAIVKQEQEQEYTDEPDVLPPLPQTSLSSINFSPHPTLSFSTPSRRHTIDEWMPSTPPPILSPSLSTTSSTTSSVTQMDHDLLRLRLRRSSRVEEMVKQFDRPRNKHHRRYSIGTTDEKMNKKSSYHERTTKPAIIRKRTFGFKPIIGVWEKRIELEEERKNS
ncbi:hypothetical protein INT45_002458 [Circinella minor]|uniref:Uncharacterized protein n=1 Tax=Circinella minor TaxID=1195481 RepID=A0A8H7SAZ1_9FUNG|nr:hypothetical protein INT45_002458 [Circinella minor]